MSPDNKYWFEKQNTAILDFLEHGKRPLLDDDQEITSPDGLSDKVLVDFLSGRIGMQAVARLSSHVQAHLIEATVDLGEGKGMRFIRVQNVELPLPPETEQPDPPEQIEYIETNVDDGKPVTEILHDFVAEYNLGQLAVGAINYVETAVNQLKPGWQKNEDLSPVPVNQRES